MSIVLDAGDQLGEGPFWDERRHELLRVDISRGLVHGWDPVRETCWERAYAGEVSAVIPRATRDGWLVACGHRLLLDDGDTLRTLASAEERPPTNRLNDCRCDPAGRLWAGTMSRERTAGAAALYRLEASCELSRVIAGTTISNGLGWSPAGDRMYFVDSPTQRIDLLDYDLASGEVANRRPFVRIDQDDGLPDGLAVDAEGGVWVCLFGGGALRRYGADGGLDEHVDLPVTNPTSAAFGGPELRTLYVTSARHRLADDQLAAEPHAGAVLALEAGIAGLPGHRWAG